MVQNGGDPDDAGLARHIQALSELTVKWAAAQAVSSTPVITRISLTPWNDPENTPSEKPTTPDCLGTTRPLNPEVAAWLRELVRQRDVRKQRERELMEQPITLPIQ